MSNLTIIDIAKLSGVSKTTVSRVINQDPTVSEKNRKRVQSVLDEYSFFPSEAARTLKTGKSKTIGIITPFRRSTFFEDEYFSTAFKGVKEVLKEYDYDMLFSSGKGFESDTIKKFIYKNQVEGIILLYSVPNDRNIEVLEKTNIPYVLVGPYNTNENMNIVYYDNKAMVKEIVANFIAKGIKNIGFFGYDEELSTSNRYLEGYKEALSENSIKYDTRIVRCAQDTQEIVYSTLNEILHLGAMPKAIITADNVITRAILSYKKEKSLDNLEIFSLEDSWQNEYLGINAVNQDFYLMGKLASEILVKAMERKEAKEQLKLNYQLIIRK